MMNDPHQCFCEQWSRNISKMQFFVVMSKSLSSCWCVMPFSWSEPMHSGTDKRPGSAISQKYTTFPLFCRLSIPDIKGSDFLLQWQSESHSVDYIFLPRVYIGTIFLFYTTTTTTTTINNILICQCIFYVIVKYRATQQYLKIMLTRPAGPRQHYFRYCCAGEVFNCFKIHSQVWNTWPTGHYWKILMSVFYTFNPWVDFKVMFATVGINIHYVA